MVVGGALFWTTNRVGQTATSPPAKFSGLFLAYFENREEGLLRDVDLADPLHALLAFLLLLEEFAFAANVAAVTFCDYVFANSGDRFARDDLAADGGLNGDLEHLAGDEFAHLRDESLAAVVGEVAVHDDGERVDGIATDEDVHLDHGRDPGAGEDVVE